MKIITKLWIGLAVLVILTPLGLLMPQYFRAGSAWGEWGFKDVSGIVGYVPKGMEKLSNIWKAPISDYSFLCFKGDGIIVQSAAYIVSALVGIVLIVGIMMLLVRFIFRKDN